MVRARRLSAAFAVLLCMAAGVITSSPALSARPECPRPLDQFVQGQIIYSLKPAYSLFKLNQRWGTSLLEYYWDASIYLLTIPTGADPETFSAQIGTDPACAFAEPNYYIYTAEAIRQ